MSNRENILKCGLWSLAAALIGAVIGGFGTYSWMSGALRSVAEITSTMYRAQLQEEAFEQYKNGEPRVAIYALQRSLEEAQRYADSADNRVVSAWDVALTHARLAKTYLRVGDKTNADSHVTKALEAFARARWTLHDSSELMAALELIDENKLVQAVQRFGESHETPKAESKAQR